jgi:hypothetical protein
MSWVGGIIGMYVKKRREKGKTVKVKKRKGKDTNKSQIKT